MVLSGESREYCEQVAFNEPLDLKIRPISRRAMARDCLHWVGKTFVEFPVAQDLSLST